MSKNKRRRTKERKYINNIDHIFLQHVPPRIIWTIYDMASYLGNEHVHGTTYDQLCQRTETVLYEANIFSCHSLPCP